MRGPREQHGRSPRRGLQRLLPLRHPGRRLCPGQPAAPRWGLTPLRGPHPCGAPRGCAPAKGERPVPGAVPFPRHRSQPGRPPPLFLGHCGTLSLPNPSEGSFPSRGAAAAAGEDRPERPGHRTRAQNPGIEPQPQRPPTAPTPQPRATGALYRLHSNDAVSFRHGGGKGGKVVPRHPPAEAEFTAGRRTPLPPPSRARPGSAAPAGACEAASPPPPLRRSPRRRGIAGRRDREARTRTARRYAST